MESVSQFVRSLVSQSVSQSEYYDISHKCTLFPIKIRNCNPKPVRRTIQMSTDYLSDPSTCLGVILMNGSHIMTSEQVSACVTLRGQRSTPAKQVSSPSVNRFWSRNISRPSSCYKRDSFRQSATTEHAWSGKYCAVACTFSDTASCRNETVGGMGDVLAGCGSGLSLSAKYIPHVAWDDELTYSFSLCSQNLLSKIDLLNNAVSSLKNRSAAR